MSLKVINEWCLMMIIDDDDDNEDEDEDDDGDLIKLLNR